jgi:hypothetical protein
MHETEQIDYQIFGSFRVALFVQKPTHFQGVLKVRLFDLVIIRAFNESVRVAFAFQVRISRSSQVRLFDLKPEK